MGFQWILLLCSLYGAEATWTFTESEIYQALQPSHAAVNQAGETFILDTAECQILKLDPSGQLVTRFGKKGQGPGETNFPGLLQTQGDHVFIFDYASKNLLCFDRKGAFIKQWKVPVLPRDLAKTSSGWVYGTWSGGFGGQKAGALKFANEKWGEPEVWHDFANGKPEEKAPDGMRLEMKDGMATIPHNPAPDVPRLAVLPGGQYLALSYPGSQLKVDIFDSNTGKVIQTVQQSSAPIPFNKDWAEKDMEKRNKESAENSKPGSFKVKLTADFPDQFPFVRQLWAHSDGLFYLQPWTANPARDQKVITFSKKGEIKPSELAPAVLNRLYHLNETHGWIGLFDEEEEQAGIAKVALADLAAFVKANPIKSKEGGGIVIMGN